MKFVAGVLLIAYSYLMAAFWQVPYILIEPGGANNVMSLISVEGRPTYQPEGQLLFLTVSLSPRITPLRAVSAGLDDSVEVVEEEQFTGGQPREEIRRLNFKLMQISKETAITVALEALGYDIEYRPAGALITYVEPGLPAAGALRTGDVIVAVDGRPVEVADDAITLVRRRRPGSSVAIVAEREGVRIDEVITTRANDEGQAQIGIHVVNNIETRFPFDIDIDTGQVGGPSAGLAFALAVIDQLTEGELTGGNVVAVTGAIEPDGTVTPVGGVAQKAVAARRAGARLMLVPADEKEVSEAQSLAGSMPVVGVANLEDALRALARIGGNVEQALPGSGIAA
ncbi:MAG TPA: S16 family serine protease [Acidimicrobiia bacterium]|nr:S16 family serine protease [Acidimicrobiia bacterium]